MGCFASDGGYLSSLPGLVCNTFVSLKESEIQSGPGSILFYRYAVNITIVDYVPITSGTLVFYSL